jgi:hypothetical protein
MAILALSGGRNGNSPTLVRPLQIHFYRLVSISVLPDFGQYHAPVTESACP